MSFQPTPAEIADRYLDSRDRLVGLIEALPDDALVRVVPGTPKWTVHDLIAHLVGCPIDLAAGHLDGAGGEAWTQSQVAARRGVPVGDLMAEWASHADRIDQAIRSGTVPAPVTYDILTHESDLRAAVGAAPTPDPRAVRFLADGFGARAAKVVAKAGLPPLQLLADDTGWSVGEAGGVSAVATETEWARALPGRRSARQVRAYSWSADPAPYLDLLCPFGSLPGVDVDVDV
jgi:uncharacterized protein (TIGR03083 family)